MPKSAGSKPGSLARAGQAAGKQATGGSAEIAGWSFERTLLLRTIADLEQQLRILQTEPDAQVAPSMTMCQASGSTQASTIITDTSQDSGAQPHVSIVGSVPDSKGEGGGTPHFSIPESKPQRPESTATDSSVDALDLPKEKLGALVAAVAARDKRISELEGQLSAAERQHSMVEAQVHEVQVRVCL